MNLFRVRIPKHWPSSCYYKSELYSQGKITYTATVALVPHKSQKVEKKEYTKYFLVSQDPYDILYNQVFSETITVKSFNIFSSKGEATLKVMTDKTAYGLDEEIKVSIDMDNSQCKLDLHDFLIELRQHSRLMGLMETFHHRRTISQGKGNTSVGINLL